MASELIDNIIDVAKIKAQYDEISEYNEKLKKDITSFAGDVKKLMDATRSAKTREDLTKSSKDLNDAIVKGTKAVDQYMAVEKDLIKQQQQLEQVEAKRYTVSSKNNQEIEKNKKLLAEQNEKLKAQLVLQDKEAGTNEKLTASNKLLAIEKRKLNLETDEGSKRLKEIIALENKNNDELAKSRNNEQKRTGGIGEYAKQLSFLKGPMATASKGFEMLGISEGVALWPIALIVGALAGLWALMKNFKPIVDKVEQSMAALGAVFEVVKNAVSGFLSGNKSLKESFSGLGSSMKEAAIEAGNLKKAQQELKDGAAALEVQNKKEQTQIQQLLLQSKNRTLSEKERMDMIDRATKIENEAHERKKKQNDEEIRIAYEKIMIGKNMTDEEKKRLKDEGLSYAELLKEKYQISDDETDKLKEALLAKEDIEQESIGIVEKAMNRRDALSDAEITKAEKRAEEKKKTDEEAAKKAIETERTMADSKLAVMVEGEEKQIAISDEAFKRTLEDLKANGQLTNELRQNLEEAHQYDLAKIKNDFAKQAEEKNKADLDTALSDFEKNTQKEAELISADYRQKELDLKKEYSKGIYSKEQYEAKLLEIQSDAVRDANDKTIVRLKKELSISGLSVDKRAELSKQLTDLQIANENASLNHTIKTNEDKVKSDKETFDKRVQIAGELASAGMELFSAIADFDKQLSDNRIADLDAEQKKNDETFNARQANLDRALMSDANREEAQKKLDKDKAANDKAIADKVKAEKVRQAKWDKAQALTNAIINTALAAVKMFADTGVLGFVFAALSTAVGLASIAKIASAKIPEYATGTIDTGDGLGIWGEKRPEVAVTRTGQIMYAEQPTLTKFDAGTRIYKSVEEFEKNKTSTTGKNFEFDYEKMAAAIPKHSFELHGNGSFTMIDKMNNRITAINRNWKIGN